MTDYTSSNEFTWCFPDINGEAVFKISPEQEKEMESLKAEIEMLKAEYLQRIEYVNKVIMELKNSVSLINTELMEIIRDIIQKLTYQVIQKEIKLDINIIQQCVESLVSFLPYKNGMVTVYLSQFDLNKIEMLDNQSMIAKAHPDFHSGDILIKSNAAEIRALLNERIDLLIRDNND